MSTTKEIILLIIQGKDLSDQELKQVSRNMEAISSSMTKAGGLAATAGAAIAAGFIPAIRSSSELQDQVTNAMTLVDAQGQEFDEMAGGMEDTAIRLSKTLGISAANVASGFYQVLSSGAQALTPEFMSMTETALKLSDVVGLEVPRSVESLSDALNAFKAPLTEANRFADVFFTTSKLAATTVPQLTAAMREASPVAGGLSQTLEDTASVLAGFASVGFKANIAGTSFRIIMNRLATGSGEAADELKRLGVEAFDPLTGKMRPIIEILRDLQTGMADLSEESRALAVKNIAGEEAFAKLSAVLGLNMDTLEDWSRQLEEGGQLEEAFEKKTGTLTKQIEFLKAETKATAIVIGNELIPYVISGVSHAREAAEAFGEWASANRELATEIAVVSVALIGTGGLTAAIGQTIRLVTVLRATMLASFGRSGPVFLAIAGVSLAVGLMRRNLDAAKRSMDGLVSSSSNLDSREAQAVATAMELFRKEAEGGGFETAEAASRRFNEILTETATSLGIVKTQFSNYEDAIAAADREIKRLGESTESAALLRVDGVVRIVDREQALDWWKAFKERIEEARDSAPIKVITPEQAAAQAGQAADSFVDGFEAQARMTPEQADRIIRGFFYGQNPVARSIGLNTEATQEAIQRHIEEDIDWESISVPPLIIHPVLEDNDIAKAFQVISGMWFAALSRMMVETNKFSDSIKAGFRVLASYVIAEISRMIAKWMVFTAIRFAGNILYPGLGTAAAAALGPQGSMGGTLVLPGTGVMAAQGGGVVTGPGARTLSDSVMVRTHQGEAYLNRDLTDKLEAALDGDGLGGGLTVINRPLLSTGSNFEALRMARVLDQRLGSYRDNNVAKGEV